MTICCVCGLVFKPAQYHAKTCSSTCRQRLRRGGHLAYIADWPQARQQARRALHQALADVIIIERTVRAARRQRRKIVSRAVIKLAPLSKGPHRGGGMA
jgi:uncharacterized protein YfaQ (DUF2300 family)